MPRKRQAPIERFEQSIMPEPNTGCWLWCAHAGRGYAVFWDGVRLTKGHRWAYEHFVGPIPIGLQIDHLCRQKMCVNPAHLEPVTCEENIHRGWKAREPGWRPAPPLPEGQVRREGIDGRAAMAELKRRAKAAGVSITEICRHANVARTTPNRWARGVTPQQAKYARIMKALRRLERKVNGDG